MEIEPLYSVAIDYSKPVSQSVTHRTLILQTTLKIFTVFRNIILSTN